MADNALSLSDEEFMKQDPGTFLDGDAEADADTSETSEEKETPVDQESESSEQSDGDEASSDDEGDSEAQEETDTAVDDEEVSQPSGDTQEEHETSSDSEVAESLDTGDQDSTDTKGDTPDTKEIDYKSAFEEVSKPFKANGAEMQVKDPKDIVRLMQMGANYQQKMAKLKPNLKVIKMLENNGLLDEAKLHHLIDLSKKNPKAVAKLIEESGVDPLDINTEASTDYKPTDYSVSDKEFNLDQALDGIKDTDTFTKTIDVLTKTWDADSKATVSENPEIIGIINTHMGNGVYDKVNAMLQQEKALGKLDGVSDVAAYRQIAEYMHENGMLREQSDESGKKDTSEVSSETETKKIAKAARDKKRKAVAPVKQTSSKKTDSEENFLGLSDDEFMKKYA